VASSTFAAAAAAESPSETVSAAVATISWAVRNGSPPIASRSATPVAVEKPSPAASASVASSQSAVATAPAATSVASRTSSATSNTPAWARWRSRLYARGSPLSRLSVPVASPMASPATPRVSSSVSGFFFWGMIEEVEAYASDSSTNPLFEKRTKSSASPDSVVACVAHAVAPSARKSRDDAASVEFRTVPSNPSSSAVRSRSTSNGVPANAAAPSGDRLTRSYASSRRSVSRATPPS